MSRKARRQAAAKPVPPAAQPQADKPAAQSAAEQKTEEQPPAPLPAGDALDRDFTGDLPPGAEYGHYSPTVRDRWHDQVIDLPDGEHTAASGWRYTIADGRFVKARFEATDAEG